MAPDEFENHLISRFPLLFRGTALQFSMGPGWYPIIELVFERLNQMYLAAEDKESWQTGVEVVTLKEKFGSLRLLFKAPITFEQHRELFALLDASKHTCEICGESGRGYSDENGFNQRARCEIHRDLIRF